MKPAPFEYAAPDTLSEAVSLLGRSADGKIASIGSDERRFYGLQFHPEVIHTDQGTRLLANYVHGIAGIPSDWTPLKHYQNHFAGYNRPDVDFDDPWQFKNFLVGSRD